MRCGDIGESSEFFDSVSKQERNRVVKAIRQEIRREWSDLWNHRIHDDRIAEDVARTNYELLFVDRGTVIKGTKDYKPPSLDGILEQNEKLLGVTLTSPHPTVGGWRKFSRDVLAKQSRWRNPARRTGEVPEGKPRNGPPKKGNRGWLHRA